MAERGVVLTYESIRRWCLKFGQIYANRLRQRRCQPGDKWHLDEVFLTINGRIHYLWRAVGQHGEVLDILVGAHGTKGQRSGFSVSCSKACGMYHGW